MLIDPERRFAPAFREVLASAGYRVSETRTESSAIESARADLPNIVVKPVLADSPGVRLGPMERLRSLCPDIQVIFVSAHADVRMAMRAVRRGAFDCLPLPCERDQLLESIQRALENQRIVAEHGEILARLKPRQHPNILTGDSPGMRGVQEIIERVADTDATVLIQGESGTGKELVARLLHERSDRGRGPFIAVNCAALPDTIIESELFGHVRGAFTGAIADKPGRFALAAGGTLFLDEIGDLSPMGQADLLRVLEDGIFRPLGSHTTVRADARIIAASNRDLQEACRQGKFREDLLYRLNVITVDLPPLRERPGDIAPLAAIFLQHFCTRHRRPLKQLSPEILGAMERFPWPGNVRQLRNAIERMVLLAPARTLQPEHLPSHLRPRDAAPPARKRLEDMTMSEAQNELIRLAIERCGGNKAAAARRLGISRRNLHYRIGTPKDPGHR